jgi:hypothetical protein
MRWPLSDVRVLLLFLLGCAPAVQHWYVPRAGDTTMSTDQIRQAADLALRDHCRRLLQGRVSATGEAIVALRFDRDGRVARARIDRSSGDRAIDDLFGTLATRMAVERVTTTGMEDEEGAVGMGFSCSPNVAIATIRPNP